MNSASGRIFFCFHSLRSDFQGLVVVIYSLYFFFFIILVVFERSSSYVSIILTAFFRLNAMAIKRNSMFPFLRPR